MEATTTENAIFGESEAFEQFRKDCLDVIQCMYEEEFINKSIKEAKQYLFNTFTNMSKNVLIDLLKFYIEEFNREEAEDYLENYITVLFEVL